jgi:hypothetical protein
VLWDKDIQDKVIDVLFPSARPDHFIMEPYLESHYRPVWVHDGVRLMERNYDGPHSEAVGTRNLMSTPIRSSNERLGAGH